MYAIVETGGKQYRVEPQIEVERSGSERVFQRIGLTERREPKECPPFEVSGLEGCMCDRCGDGFWSRASEEKLAAASVEHRARHNAAPQRSGAERPLSG